MNVEPEAIKNTSISDLASMRSADLHRKQIAFNINQNLN